MARVAVLSGTGMADLVDELSSSSSTSSEIRVDSRWGQVPSIVVETKNGEVLLIDRHHREGE